MPRYPPQFQLFHLTIMYNKHKIVFSINSPLPEELFDLTGSRKAVRLMKTAKYSYRSILSSLSLSPESKHHWEICV